MATYPTANVKRTNRRNLGRAQSVQHPPAGVTITSSTTSITATFSVPVVVNSTIPITISGGITVLSQTQTSSTVIVLTASAAVATHTYALAANCGAISTFQGGGNAAAAGTF